MIKWDKGKALEFLLESLGEIFFHVLYFYFAKIFFSSTIIWLLSGFTRIKINNSKFYTLAVEGFDNSSDVFPIYIGDDRTDEDAFKVYKFNLRAMYTISFKILIVFVSVLICVF